MSHVGMAGWVTNLCDLLPFLQIMRIRLHKVQHIGEMSFLQHEKCECR